MLGRNTIVALVVTVIAAVLPFVLRNNYFTHLAILVCISLTLALSLNVTLKMGQLSLGQGAFMAIGAYGSAILSMKFGVPVAPSFFLAALLAFAIAVVLGPIFLRVKGVYFVLITFCFGQIVDLILQDWTGMTGGNNGLTGIPSLFSRPWRTPANIYMLALMMAAISYLLVHLTYRSRIGAVLSSIEEREALALSFGLSAIRHRVAAFGFSAFLAGISGAFFAHYIGFLNPSTFAFSITIQALMINVIGGAKWPIGVVIGAIIVVPMPELLRDAKDYQYILFGSIVIVMLLFANQGIVGLFQKKGQA